MTNIKKNERYIPLSNYIKAILIVVVAILLVWYIFSWYRVLKENKVSTSYLIKEKIISNEINDLKEVNNIFLEAPSSYFIYVSYTGNEDIYNMEKTIKPIIVDYNLNNSFYYLNVTSLKDDSDMLNKINESLGLKDIKISSVPTVIYFKDGKAMDLIKREDENIMDVGDLQKLIDINRISK